MVRHPMFAALAVSVGVATTSARVPDVPRDVPLAAETLLYLDSTTPASDGAAAGGASHLWAVSSHRAIQTPLSMPQVYSVCKITNEMY
jgi:hypothetical protein